VTNMGNPFGRCRLRLWFLLEWAPGLKTPDRVVELNGVPTFGLGDTVHEGSGFGGNQPASQIVPGGSPVRGLKMMWWSPCDVVVLWFFEAVG
jgi:hypothetical protein